MSSPRCVESRVTREGRERRSLVRDAADDRRRMEEEPDGRWRERITRDARGRVRRVVVTHRAQGFRLPHPSDYEWDFARLRRVTRHDYRGDRLWRTREASREWIGDDWYGGAGRWQTTSSTICHRGPAE